MPAHVVTEASIDPVLGTTVAFPGTLATADELRGDRVARWASCAAHSCNASSSIICSPKRLATPANNFMQFVDGRMEDNKVFAIV